MSLESFFTYVLVAALLAIVAILAWPAFTARRLSRLPKPPEPLELAKDEIADEGGAVVILGTVTSARAQGARTAPVRRLRSESAAAFTDRIFDAPDKPATVEPKRIA